MAGLPNEGHVIRAMSRIAVKAVVVVLMGAGAVAGVRAGDHGPGSFAVLKPVAKGAPAGRAVLSASSRPASPAVLSASSRAASPAVLSASSRPGADPVPRAPRPVAPARPVVRAVSISAPARLLTLDPT